MIYMTVLNQLLYMGVCFVDVCPRVKFTNGSFCLPVGFQNLINKRWFLTIIYEFQTPFPTAVDENEKCILPYVFFIQEL